jgi:RNA recognition motif-containing protein
MAETANSTATLSQKEKKKLQFFQRLKKKKKPALSESGGEGNSKKRKWNGDKPKTGKKGGKGKGKRRDTDTQIYIGGLPYKMSEDDVRQMFNTCGNIRSINLPINKQGKPTGFGFIVFESAESIPKAMALDGQEVDGRFIQVISNRVASSLRILLLNRCGVGTIRSVRGI